MRRTISMATCLALVAALAALAPETASPVGPSAAKAAVGTFFNATSDVGFILDGGGHSYDYSPNNATFGAPGGGPGRVEIGLYGIDGGLWDLQFWAPNSTGALEVGTYTNVGTVPFNAYDQAGMRATFGNLTCDLQAAGSTFTVKEVNIGPLMPSTGYNRVIVFDATFTVQCVNSPAKLTGEVRFEAPPDTTAPSISQLPDITTEAADSSGLQLYYNYPEVQDAIDPNPQSSCSPAYGDVVPIGVTTVTCTATDYSGNTATMSFTVTVLSPLQYSFSIDSTGAVNTATGVATVSGKATCSRPGYIFVSYGTVSQPFTKRVTLSGNFQSFVQMDCGSSPVRWSETAVPYPNGLFKGGQARVDVLFAGACDSYRCFYIVTSRNVVLNPAKK